MKIMTSTDGTPIAYQQGGKGPHLLLVHGTAASRTRWASIMPRFEQHFTVTVMDRRGRGDSGDGAQYAIEREFEDVVALVEALDGPVLLFGHSYGAICALEAALLTERLSGLVLYEPPIFDGKGSTAGQVERLEALLAAGDRKAVVETFLNEVVGVPPPDLEKMKSSPAWAARVAAAHTLPRELRSQRAYRLSPARFGGLTLPVLLLLGGDSPPPFREAIAKLVGAIPHARIAIMPGQGHVAMDTAPDLVVDALFGFREGTRRLI